MKYSQSFHFCLKNLKLTEVVGWIAVGLIFFLFFCLFVCFVLSYCHHVCLPANLIRHRDSCIGQLGCVHKSIIPPLSLSHTHTVSHIYIHTHYITHIHTHTHIHTQTLPLFSYPTLTSISWLVPETLWGSLAVHKDACNTIKCNKLKKK